MCNLKKNILGTKFFEDLEINLVEIAGEWLI